MQVIALKGRRNCGKSHTLNIVYQLLLNDGYTQVAGHFKELGEQKQEDFLDILEKDGQRIGFATMGDYSEDNKEKVDDSIKELLKTLENAGCEVAICACSTHIKGTLQEIEAYPNHIIINKKLTSIKSEYRIKNGEDARKFFALI